MISLGIDLRWNRTYTAQDNAKVERMQGTTSRWVEYKTCQHRQELQDKLQEAILIQRTRYKVSRLQGKTRLAVYPELLYNPRSGSQAHIDLNRLYAYLSQVTFVRKVNPKSGLFTFFDRVTLLSGQAKFRSIQRVFIKFSQQHKHWMLYDDVGQLIATLAADYLNEKQLHNLTICQRTYARCQIFMSQ